jgi:hypothetical protein
MHGHPHPHGHHQQQQQQQQQHGNRHPGPPARRAEDIEWLGEHCSSARTWPFADPTARTRAEQQEVNDQDLAAFFAYIPDAELRGVRNNKPSLYRTNGVHFWGGGCQR